MLVGNFCPTMFSNNRKQMMKSEFRTIFSDQTEIAFKDGYLFLDEIKTGYENKILIAKIETKSDSVFKLAPKIWVSSRGMKSLDEDDF